MTKRVIAENLRSWIDALRSGEFKQSRLCYHGRKGGHCCLGVAQVVGGLKLYEGDAGLGDRYGLTPGEFDKLVNLNDNGHRSFAYIADHIEKKILPRFLTK